MVDKFENIAEAYIQGKLTPEEASQFENSLMADPNLKEEFEFENTIIDGIKSYRKAELKAYLNTVVVSSSFFRPIQAAALFAAAGVVGGLLLLFVQVNKRFSDDKKITPIKETVAPQIHAEPIASTEPEIKSYDPAPSAVAPQVIVASKHVLVKNKLPNKNAVAKRPETRGKSSDIGDENPNHLINEPDLVTLNDFESKNVNVPETELSASNMDKKTQIGVTLAAALNRGSIHYQYFNNKLYLYGNFNKGTYELIEMYANKQRTLYMYFDKEFYEIAQNQIDISEMQPIKDKNLIGELKKLIRMN